MITLVDTQLIAIYITLFFAFHLMVSPINNFFRTEKEIKIYTLSRRLLILALVILGVHFILHRIYGFRNMGGMQSPVINCLFYVPFSICMNLSMANLLYFGKFKSWHVPFALIVIGIIYGLLLGTSFFAEGGLLGDSKAMRLALYISVVVAALMLIHYMFDGWTRYLKIKRALEDNYDVPQQDTVTIFVVLISFYNFTSLVTAIVVFLKNENLLVIHSLISYTVLSLYCMNFVRFAVTGMMRVIASANDDIETESVELLNDTNTSNELSPRITSAVEEWLKTGHQYRAGITAEEISTEMCITRHELKIYIQSMGYPKIGSWLAKLRIEEAKRLLLASNDYSHDAVAEKCGFSSREYFQTCFRNIVGMPPMQWQKENVR